MLLGALQVVHKTRERGASVRGFRGIARVTRGHVFGAGGTSGGGTA